MALLPSALSTAVALSPSTVILPTLGLVEPSSSRADFLHCSLVPPTAFRNLSVALSHTFSSVLASWLATSLT